MTIYIKPEIEAIKDKIISQIKIEIETFKQNELPAELKKISPIKPGSRNLSKWKEKGLVSILIMSQPLEMLEAKVIPTL